MSRSPEVRPGQTVLLAGREGAEDVFRGFDANHHVVLLASEADTVATRTSEDQRNPNGRALQIVVITANLEGTDADYTPKLQRKNADGSHTDIWEAAAAIEAAGTFVYEIGEFTGTKVSQVTERACVLIPSEWRLVLTVATADGSNRMDTYVEADVVI